MAGLLTTETLQRLVRQLEATDIDEMEVVWGRSRLYIRRDPRQRGAAQSPEVREAPGIPVIAPLTGVFYARPSPDQPAFVNPGDPVQPGQVVALIETMKLFNEVQAEIGGEVLTVGARDGDLVEAGQPLMYLRPREESEQP